MRLISLWFLISYAVIVQGQTVDLPETISIGLFGHEQVREFAFTPSQGRYVLLDNQGNTLIEAGYHTTINLRITPRGIQVSRLDTIVAVVQEVVLQGRAFTNAFIITPGNKNLNFRVYDGDLQVLSAEDRLKIINIAPLESYVAGTVQSESGFNRHNVFYQVQAIIIRTYAINNLRRHERDGFHLCDRVHCQANYGRTQDKEIIRAVAQTRGEVLTDEAGALLNTVYHANCGGETVNSEDLWIQALPYLRSDTEDYCQHMPGANWEKTIPVADFKQYLRSHFGLNPPPALWQSIITLNPTRRKHHLDPERTIPLSHVRTHFGLRSTFFSIQEKNGLLYLTGRGYGHGVGLCQEGAMERARKGYSRKEILQFYFNGAQIRLSEPLVVF